MNHYTRQFETCQISDWIYCFRFLTCAAAQIRNQVKLDKRRGNVCRLILRQSPIQRGCMGR